MPANRESKAADESPVRIFAGADVDELLPLKVLEYSIRRHTRLPVALQTVDNSLVTMPTDPRFAPYTRFSYGRFAIPRLAGYRGRAIYMDSDMLVFGDVAEIWNTPFDGAKILIEKLTRRSRRRGRATAIMLMDCAALRWDPEEIVKQLGAEYDYEELMSIVPLLEDGEIRDALPLGWNSLDRRNADTRLLHFTRIRTQPWVYPRHPLGHLWIAEVKQMLADDTLSPDFIRAEVACGHVRPSLIAELGIDEGRGRILRPQELMAIDRRAGFIPHKELRKAVERRDSARAAQDPRGNGWKKRFRGWRKSWQRSLESLRDSF